MKNQIVACNPQTIKDQLSRTEGQIGGIAKMVDGKRTCAEVLQQIVAARASLQKLAIMLLEAEAAGCLGSGDEATPNPKLKELEHVVANLFKLT